MIQVSPGEDKVSVLAKGLLELDAFGTLNNVPRLAGLHFSPPPHARNRFQLTGLYHNNTIWVDLSKTRTPVATPVRSWSFTGWKSDMTPAGVLAHEFGHHVWYALLPYRKIRSALREIVQVEHAVSGYEPCVEESFAEAFRVFMLNPDLLRCGWPGRYEFMLTVGLKPLHEIPWREILVNAHPRFHEIGCRLTAITEEINDRRI